MGGIHAAMLGIGGLAASVPAGSYQRTETSPTDAVCNITFSSSGSYSVTDDLASSGTWKTGGGTGADYWVRWTNTSGTLTTGTAGSWQQLSSDRTFGVTFTGVSGSKVCTGTVEIAIDSGGSTIIATGSITITAQVDP